MIPNNYWKRTVALFALTSVVESLAFGHLSAFTPIYLRSLGVESSAIPYWTGLLSAMAFVIGLPLLPYWGIWADRYGRKLVIIRSSVAAVLIYALTAASRNVYDLAGVRLLGGFVFGNTGVMLALQSDVTPREKLGFAVALISAGGPVGMAVGPYFGGFIVDHWGVRPLLLLDSVLTAAVILALILFLKDVKPAPRHEDAPKPKARDAIRDAVSSPHAKSLFLCWFLAGLAVNLTQPYIPILIESLSQGNHLGTTVGKVLTAAGIAMAISTPIWGRLGDKGGHLRLLRVSMAALLLSIAGQALATHIWQLTILRVAQGLCQGGIGALAIALLALHTPADKRSSALNLSLLPQQFAWFLGPVAGSFISQYSLRGLFWAGSACMTLALASSLLIPRSANSSA